MEGLQVLVDGIFQELFFLLFNLKCNAMDLRVCLMLRRDQNQSSADEAEKFSDWALPWVEIPKRMLPVGAGLGGVASATATLSSASGPLLEGRSVAPHTPNWASLAIPAVLTHFVQTSFEVWANA